MVGFATSDSLPPSKLYVIVYSIASQFAVYSLFPVEPCAIVTSFVATSTSVPVQPINLYPSFVGSFNNIYYVSIV